MTDGVEPGHWDPFAFGLRIDAVSLFALSVGNVQVMW
jgi:hypothetical protein